MSTNSRVTPLSSTTSSVQSNFFSVTHGFLILDFHGWVMCSHPVMSTLVITRCTVGLNVQVSRRRCTKAEDLCAFSQDQILVVLFLGGWFWGVELCKRLNCFCSSRNVSVCTSDHMKPILNVSYCRPVIPVRLTNSFISAYKSRRAASCRIPTSSRSAWNNGPRWKSISPGWGGGGEMMGWMGGGMGEVEASLQ